MTTRDPETPASQEPSTQPDASHVDEIEGEDYYFDGPYLVFTEAYHRRRGFCCHSGCRHCPYGFSKGSAADDDSPNES